MNNLPIMERYKGNRFYLIIDDIGISVEILFGQSLLVYCAELLNVELYFRVIDLAFA